MESKSIISNEVVAESNKLIAEFDEWKFIPAHVWTFEYVGSIQYEDSWIKTIDGISNQIKEVIKYNSSWDLLMPIIKKSKQVELKYEYDWTVVNMWVANVNIENTWLAVVEFIKWYNLNKNNT